LVPAIHRNVAQRLPSWRRLVHHPLMIPPQRLPASLTPLDVALAALLDRLEPVAPTELPLAQALGCVAAEMPPLGAVPPCDIAAADGFAFCARDLVGASSYSPLPLATSLAWVEAGDAMPQGCDCVISADLVDQSGPMAQVLGEAIPGQGVRRAGGDIACGSLVLASGRRVGPLELGIARAAGWDHLRVRRPRLCLLNIPATSGTTATAQLISECARGAGADVACAEATGRDAAWIAKAMDAAIDAGACDLLVTIGGSGVGRTDAAVLALAQRGEVFAHGIALQPGRTAAVGRIEKVPVIALPGAPDQALAAWWTLARPVLDRLSARQKRQRLMLRLARKIASSVGIAEIVLLQKDVGTWMPLAVGELSFETLACADAYLVVAGGSEGFAAGTPVGAYMMWDCYTGSG
jgi:molybdopterin molybdotransferase